MIKAKDLKINDRVPGLRFGPSSSGVSLDDIKDYLIVKNEELYGYPITITKDQISSGGLFNGSIEDCIVIVNNDHKNDYFKYVISLRKQGKTGVVQCYYYGYSELTYKMNRDEARKNKLTGMVANKLFGANEQAYNEEYDYYNTIDELFRQLQE